MLEIDLFFRGFLLLHDTTLVQRVTVQRVHVLVLESWDPFKKAEQYQSATVKRVRS